MLGNRFYVNPASNEIAVFNGWSLEAPIKVEPKAMEVLLLLAKQEGKVVDKELIINKIWNNYGGASDALLQSISKLRKAFRDDAKKPTVIETISKKGYRLKLKVTNAQFQAMNNGNNHQNQSPMIIIRQVGWLTGFIERLTNLRFLLAFILFSAVLIMVLSLLYQIIFWLSIA